MELTFICLHELQWIRLVGWKKAQDKGRSDDKALESVARYTE
jgi:hypothetical protein